MPDLLQPLNGFNSPPDLTIDDHASFERGLQLYAALWTTELSGGARPDVDPPLPFTWRGKEVHTDHIYPIGRDALFLGAYSTSEKGSAVIFCAQRNDERWVACPTYFELSNEELAALGDTNVADYYYRMTSSIV